jgi:hypothetical protein
MRRWLKTRCGVVTRFERQRLRCDSYDNSYRNGYGYGGGARNDVSISNGSTGGYVPDPVGADIPPLIIPTNCWVRRAAYDPSGAYFGQVLVNLCRSSDRVTVTSLKSRAKMPETATVPSPHPVDQSSSPPATPLKRLSRFSSPLVLSRVHWVEPKLVAEITYLTWTVDNLLRQTVYVGLRGDKPADQVRRE